MVCQYLWLFTGQKQKFLREIESNKYAGDQRKIREIFMYQLYRLFRPLDCQNFPMKKYQE